MGMACGLVQEAECVDATSKAPSFAARRDPRAATDHVSKTSVKGTKRVQVGFWRPQKPELGTGNFGILRKLRAAASLWSPG